MKKQKNKPFIKGLLGELEKNKPFRKGLPGELEKEVYEHLEWVLNKYLKMKKSHLRHDRIIGIMYDSMLRIKLKAIR